MEEIMPLFLFMSLWVAGDLISPGSLILIITRKSLVLAHQLKSIFHYLHKIQ